MTSRPRIIFFVGPDMCGKTQMAKAVADELYLPYYKASAEQQGFLNDQNRFINDIRYACPARLDMLKQIGCGIVYDRGYPCEWVYSTFFNRPTDVDMIWRLDREYADLGAVIIIPHRSSYKGIQDDLDPSIGESKLNKLGLLYDDFASLTKCPVLKLNVDDEDINRELTDILTFLKANP